MNHYAHQLNDTTQFIKYFKSFSFIQYLVFGFVFIFLCWDTYYHNLMSGFTWLMVADILFDLLFVFRFVWIKYLIRMPFNEELRNAIKNFVYVFVFSSYLPFMIFKFENYSILIILLLFLISYILVIFINAFTEYTPFSNVWNDIKNHFHFLFAGLIIYLMFIPGYYNHEIVQSNSPLYYTVLAGFFLVIVADVFNRSSFTVTVIGLKFLVFLYILARALFPKGVFYVDIYYVIIPFTIFLIIEFLKRFKGLKLLKAVLGTILFFAVFLLALISYSDFNLLYQALVTSVFSNLVYSNWGAFAFNRLCVSVILVILMGVRFRTHNWVEIIYAFIDILWYFLTVFTVYVFFIYDVKMNNYSYAYWLMNLYFVVYAVLSLAMHYFRKQNFLVKRKNADSTGFAPEVAKPFH